MGSKCTWLAPVALWLAVFTTLPPANAAPMVSLPISQQQLESSNGFFGGTASCSTSGTYNATSLIWTQSGACSGTGLVTDSGSVQLTSQASLAGLVDNTGHVLGGAFTLFGVVPELGLTNWSLLASGRLLDAFYGSYTPGFGGISGANALIDLDFVIDPLEHLGSILLWVPHASISAWSPASGNAPWSVDVAASNYRNFSGTQYWFFDRDTFLVSEPPAIVLLGLALVLAIAAVNRRRGSSWIRGA